MAIVAVVAGAPPTAATLGWAALSGILDLAGLWALYRGLSRGSMSVVAPLAATAALVPAVYGIAIGERPSAMVVGGIILAVVGVALAGRSESEAAAGSRVASAWRWSPRCASGSDSSHSTPPARGASHGLCSRTGSARSW